MSYFLRVALAITLSAMVVIGGAAFASPFTPVHSAAKAFECKETTEASITSILENLPASYIKEELEGWPLVTFMQAFNAQEPVTNIRADKLIIVGSFMLGPKWVAVFSIAGCLVDVYFIKHADLEKLGLGIGDPA